MIYGPRPDFYNHTPGINTRANARPPGELAFIAPNPSRSPAAIRPAVMQGYDLMMNTTGTDTTVVSAVHRLSCRNCHFEAGRSRDGISLVGVASKYPRPVPDQRGGVEFVTLAEQVAQCFRTHIATTPPPPGSNAMSSILAYLQWISVGVPQAEAAQYALSPLHLVRAPRLDQGRRVYAEQCALCHGPDGQGAIGPALWGPASFTSDAQFASVEILGSFIHHFMPFKNPRLDPETASDVAAFLLSRPRRQSGRNVNVPSAGAPLPAVAGLPPAPSMTDAAPPPSPGESEQQLRTLAARMQSESDGMVVKGGVPLSAAVPAARNQPTGPMTLERKLGQLGRPLPVLLPHTWSYGSVLVADKTKPGSAANIPLIQPPPLPTPPTDTTVTAGAGKR